MTIIDAGVKILDGVARKKLDEVSNPKVREYLTNVWGDLLSQAPALFETLVGPGEVILSGKYLAKTKKIMSDLQGDVMAFKNKQIDEAVFRDLVTRRKAAIFALYNAQKIEQAKPSVQKVLMAAETVAGILLKYGIPFLLAAL